MISCVCGEPIVYYESGVYLLSVNAKVITPYPGIERVICFACNKVNGVRTTETESSELMKLFVSRFERGIPYGNKK